MCIRSSASSNSAQTQLQALKDSMARVTSERDMLKKDLETKNGDILEKNKTITQVKKIGRRYKSQYEELKAQHDKVGLRLWKSVQVKGCSSLAWMKSETVLVSVCSSWLRKRLLKQEVRRVRARRCSRS